MEWNEFLLILRPSKLGGIGVFAAVDIEEGRHVSDDNFEVRVLKKTEVPPQFHQYCIHKNDDEFYCPPRFDCMQMGWFINHSETPNVVVRRDPHKRKLADDTCEMNPAIMSLITCKKICAGDEIFVDYNSLNEPRCLRESYYLRLP